LHCSFRFGFFFHFSPKDSKIFIFQYIHQNEKELNLQGVVEDSKGMKLLSINKTPHLQHRMSKIFKIFKLVGIVYSEIKIKNILENKKKLIEFQLNTDQIGNFCIVNQTFVVIDFFLLTISEELPIC
jgi:hypothetical protein